MTIDYKKIGARIQYSRTLLGISQEALAEAATVSRVYISALERGEKGASLETIIDIANSLRITTDDLLADYLSENHPSPLSTHFDLLHDCTMEETDFLLAALQSIKQILRRFRITK